MSQKPYLNLGCGRIILPDERPGHHSLVDAAIYNYPLWRNVDRNAEPGVDEVVDVFTYPFPWEDNSFDGALLTHLVEHIPHEIKVDDRHILAGVATGETTMRIRPGKIAMQLDNLARIAAMQDGWYAFFSELYRVLTPGAVVHILSPYGWSQGAITDPTHTRLVTEHTFTHSMQPDPNSPFKYETGGIHFEQVAPAAFRITEMFQHLLPVEGEPPSITANKQAQLQYALMTNINVAYELYIKLRVVKPD